MKKPTNKQGQGSEELSDDNLQGQNDYSSTSGAAPQGTSQNDAQDENGSDDETAQGRDFNSRNEGSYNNYGGKEQGKQEGSDDESEEEGDEEGEYEYADQEDGQQKEGGFDIKKIAQKVKDYIKGESGASLDQETIVKYASVAIVGLYGLRKGGLIGGLLLSAAVGLVAKYLLEEEGSEQGQEQGQEAEAQAA